MAAAPEPDMLTDQQRTILDVLVSARGGYVQISSILSEMYWMDDEPENARTVLAVQIRNMRKKGYVIENGYGRYRLVNTQ